MTNAMTAEITIAEYQQNVNELWDALMGLEMQLVEQLEVYCIFIHSFVVFSFTGYNLFCISSGDVGWLCSRVVSVQNGPNSNRSRDAVG